jgi:cytochrome c oxidase subunit 2
VVLDAAPPDALVLQVRAFRWRCTIKHDKDVVTDDLRVPVGRAIKLVVHTPEHPVNGAGIEVSLVGTDVQKAVVQGTPVEIVFRIDRPGTYAWKCPTITPPPMREEPGVRISDEARAQQDPVKPLYAMPAAEYAAMIDANNPTDPANVFAVGKRLYEKKGCSSCHTIDGSPRVGPSWAGIWGTRVTLADGSTATVDADYVKRSIVTPQAFQRPGFPPVMPSFEGQLKPAELDALVAFIASLKDVKPAASP